MLEVQVYGLELSDHTCDNSYHVLLYWQMNVGWAEPIIDYLSRTPNTIVQPTTDSIDQWSIEYENTAGVHSTWRGVFLWDMR